MNITLNLPAWMSEAICASVDPAAYFPEQGAPPAAAKRLCWSSCPVREDCLQFAMDEGLIEYGLFGGMTPNERKKLRREQAA